MQLCKAAERLNQAYAIMQHAVLTKVLISGQSYLARCPFKNIDANFRCMQLWEIPLILDEILDRTGVFTIAIWQISLTDRSFSVQLSEILDCMGSFDVIMEQEEEERFLALGNFLKRKYDFNYSVKYGFYTSFQMLFCIYVFKKDRWLQHFLLYLYGTIVICTMYIYCIPHCK
jgi:hypothetical protein